MKKKALQWICLVLLMLQLTGIALIFWKTIESAAGRFLLFLIHGWVSLWLGGLMVLTVLIYFRVKEKPGAKDIGAAMVLGFLTVVSFIIIYGRVF